MLTIAPVIDRNTLAACMNKVLELNRRGGKDKYNFELSQHDDGTDFVMITHFANGKCQDFIFYHINDPDEMADMNRYLNELIKRSGKNG